MSLREWCMCGIDDLADPGALGFSVGGGGWPFQGLVVRQNGQFAAFLNVCAHLKHPLNLDADGFMTPDRRLLRCASHGALYVPTTGICVAGPCAGKSLTKLSCWVEDGTVLVLAPASMRELEALAATDQKLPDRQGSQS